MPRPTCLQCLQAAESNLESHDLGIPVPLPSDKHHMFNIFLLSGHDMQPPMNAVARVERLYHKTGGRDLGVIFLLQENPPHGNGTTAFMELQMKLCNFDIPVMPLTTLTNLQSTLSSFQRQLFNSRAAEASIPQSNPVVALLPYCSNNPLPEHARNVLSDLVHSIPDLAQAATTRDGQAALRQWFSSDSMPQVAEDVIAFWEQEFVVD